MDMVGVILAGGSNRRFPVLKGFMEINGERVIERNLRLLGGLFSRVAISTNRPDAYFYTGAELLGDLYPSTGPIVGICSSLVASGADSVFVIACDMPFVRKEVVELIIAGTGGADVVVCEYEGMLHPLLGSYSKGLIGLMEERILSGRTELLGFLDEIDCRVITTMELKQTGEDGKSFVNINTPEDYSKYTGG